MATAAAALFAAPVAGSSSIAADPAVSAASRLSPADRCAVDALSVALSFLDLGNFAAASRVCRHWQRTAELQSAWPEFSVERLIEGLIEDERHWTQSRSKRVNANQLSAGALERLAQSVKWRRLSELYLYASPDTSVSQNQVAQLPHLQSLRLSCFHLADVAAGFGSLAPRLQALRCDSWSVSQAVQSHLHLLANLRVLVLYYAIGAQALLPLHQLEYLQLRFASTVSRDLLLAIRRLSVRHRLRHLSVTSYTNLPLDLDLLVAQLSHADSGLAPAALVSIRLCENLSNAPPSVLLSLPNLTRLHWSGDATGSQSTAHPQLSSPPSSLQQLHLSFDSDHGGAVQLLHQATVRAPQLRELRMGRLPPSFDHLIRPLRSLRLLSITLSQSSQLSLELARSLASLPLFSQLVVRQSIFQQQSFGLTGETLRCIAESRSWRLIRLAAGYYPPQLILPDDAGARLAERLADFRVRSEWRFGASEQRLMISADGAAAWQQTAI